MAFLAATFVAQSQNRYSPWGVVPPADLQMTYYPQDSAVGAAVLQDVGKMYLKEIDGGYWSVRFENWRRIKVFNTAALKEGNLSIIYAADKNTEKLNDLEVQIIFPDGTVKAVPSENVYSERLTERWKIKKIFIPGLQKGCVLEYRYRLTKDYSATLYDWFFQDEMPVRWSEITLQVPDFFESAVLLQNIEHFDLEERDKKEPKKNSFGKKYDMNILRFGKANLPALKPEPYITSLDDYRVGLQFQNGYIKTLGDSSLAQLSWQSFVADMSQHSAFGLQYLDEVHTSGMWSDFLKVVEGDSTLAFLEKTRQFVAEKMKWDGDFSLYVSQSLEKCYQAKEGNSADVNLTVIALLRRTGIDAYPILVSTRNNGKVQKKYPFRRQFNSVIVGVRLNGKIILLDATDPMTPLGQLNQLHYNYEGFLLDVAKPEWVDIPAPAVSMRWLMKMRVDENGGVKGKLSIQMNNEIAARWRKDLQKTPAETLVRNRNLLGALECEVDSIQWTGLDDLQSPLSVKLDFRQEAAFPVNNDYIYVKPILDFLMKENPFKAEKRTFPISFTFPMKANYVVNLEIPSNYSLEEIPKTERISLPDNLGNITFSCTQDAGQPQIIQLSLRMQLNSMDYDVGYYDSLRTFFNLLVEKINLQLVLKKNNISTTQKH